MFCVSPDSFYGTFCKAAAPNFNLFCFNPPGAPAGVQRTLLETSPGWASPDRAGFNEGLGPVERRRSGTASRADRGSAPEQEAGAGEDVGRAWPARVRVRMGSEHNGCSALLMLDSEEVINLQQTADSLSKCIKMLQILSVCAASSANGC